MSSKLRLVFGNSRYVLPSDVPLGVYLVGKVIWVSMYGVYYNLPKDYNDFMIAVERLKLKKSK